MSAQAEDKSATSEIVCLFFAVLYEYVPQNLANLARDWTKVVTKSIRIMDQTFTM